MTSAAFIIHGDADKRLGQIASEESLEPRNDGVKAASRNLPRCRAYERWTDYTLNGRLQIAVIKGVKSEATDSQQNG